MPNPALGLVADIANLFDDRPRSLASPAQLRKLLAHHLWSIFFPGRVGTQPDAKGMSCYIADSVLLSRLTKRQRQPSPAPLARLCRRFLRRPLASAQSHPISRGGRRYRCGGRARRAPIFARRPGGIVPGRRKLWHRRTRGDDAPAAATRWQYPVCRLQSRRRPRRPGIIAMRSASRNRGWPCIPTQPLCGAAGLGPLHALLAQQVPERGQQRGRLSTRHLNTLVQRCGGTRWLSGSPHARQPLGARTEPAKSQ